VQGNNFFRRKHVLFKKEIFRSRCTFPLNKPKRRHQSWQIIQAGGNFIWPNIPNYSQGCKIIRIYMGTTISAQWESRQIYIHIFIYIELEMSFRHCEFLVFIKGGDFSLQAIQQRNSHNSSTIFFSCHDLIRHMNVLFNECASH
jgi:hypothetical protein